MKKGFTIVELLVSITILAIGLLSLGIIFPAGIRSTLLTQQNTQAIEYCQQEIEYLRTLSWNDAALDAGVHGPDSISSGNGGVIYVVLYNVNDDYPVTDMKRVIVSVSWRANAGAGKRKTHTRSITTYISRY